MPWTHGIVHIGANEGQERDIYRDCMIPVLWIEPIPEVFLKLQKNIKDYPNQCALQALMGESDGGMVDFFLANNGGASSSMLVPHLHKVVASDIKFDRVIRLPIITFDTLVRERLINIKEYNTLIMDTQGSELLILRGAQSELQNFDFVKTEISSFESYVGCPNLKTFSSFMDANGFDEISRECIFKHSLGEAYDVIFRRRSKKFSKLNPWLMMFR